MPETYSRERLYVENSDNAHKFNLHFFEHAECFIAVCSLENVHVHPFGVLPPQRTAAAIRFQDVCFQVSFL